jgi:hypothetical protein
MSYNVYKCAHMCDTCVCVCLCVHILGSSYTHACACIQTRVSYSGVGECIPMKCSYPLLLPFFSVSLFVPRADGGTGNVHEL